jgi:hypothetical protein
MTAKRNGGRPRGSKNHKTIIRKIANERHTVRINGKRRRVSTLELALHTLGELAFEGKPRAIDHYIQFLDRYRPDPLPGGAYAIAPAKMSPEEWIRDQMEKNKTRKPPEDYKG